VYVYVYVHIDMLSSPPFISPIRSICLSFFLSHLHRQETMRNPCHTKPNQSNPIQPSRSYSRVLFSHFLFARSPFVSSIKATLFNPTRLLFPTFTILLEFEYNNQTKPTQTVPHATTRPNCVPHLPTQSPSRPCPCPCPHHSITTQPTP